MRSPCIGGQTPWQHFGMDDGRYSIDQIKHAYQARVRSDHPDRGGNGGNVNNLIRAYRTLMDCLKKYPKYTLFDLIDEHSFVYDDVVQFDISEEPRKVQCPSCCSFVFMDESDYFVECDGCSKILKIVRNKTEYCE
ncbi:hypothetical protein ACOME3_001756 [Neoechinorhynchus agilis]